MEMGRCLVHVQHHIEHPQMGACVLQKTPQNLSELPPPVLRPAYRTTVAHVADLEDRFMEQLFLFTLPDMLIVVRYLISRFRFSLRCRLRELLKDHMIDLLQILVAENQYSAPSGSGLHSPLRSCGCCAGCSLHLSCPKLVTPIKSPPFRVILPSSILS